uniref:Uncharacterized protein n=1 Tax=Podoviridae sp. ctx8L26 TaxID=2826588 RepID=A0A8S5MWP2_9CAUD|nr:MAG TPA: hypothetical protein [Podoviridae sp. ctx8L26]
MEPAATPVIRPVLSTRGSRHQSSSNLRYDKARSAHVACAPGLVLHSP